MNNDVRKQRVGDWLIPNATVFVASACVMIVEIVAGRIVSRHLGQSLYTWTTVIGVVLAGISIGNYVGGRMADRFNPAKALALMFLLASASCLTIPAVNYAMGEWRLLWESGWTTRIVLHILFTFLVPALALGTISPLVAKMALTTSQHYGRTIGDVYAWGAAGSIAGTFLAGFYLIATMGNLAVIALVAGILAVLAVLYARKAFWTYGWLVLCSVGVFATVGPGTTASALGTRLHLREVLGEDILYARDSQYSWIMVEETEPGIRGLYLDKLLHTKVSMNDPQDLLYDYTWVYASVTDAAAPPGEPVQAFVIGGGGCAFPRYLEAARPGSRIDVAEIDPEVTRVTFDELGLDPDSSLAFFDMDARHHVADLIRKKRSGEDVALFDFIYGDSINDYSVPYHLTTREFNEFVDELLNPDGLYLLNLIDIMEPGHFLSSVVMTCREVFPYVYLFSCKNTPSVRDTFVVVCSKIERDMPDVLTTLRETYAFQGSLVSTERIERMLADSDGVVLTDSFAPVENLLANVVRRNRGHTLARYVEEAVRAANAGDFDLAMKELENALSIEPNSPRVFFNMGLTCFKSDQHREAFAHFQRAVQLNPGHTKSRNYLAMYYARGGRLDEAIREWQAVLQIDPEDAGAHDDLAIALAQQGRVSEAIPHWKRAIELRPQHASTMNNLATAYSIIKRPDDAIRWYERAISIDPSIVEAHVNLGHELADLGRREDAAVHYRAALAQRPEMAGVAARLREIEADPVPPVGHP